MKIAYLVTDPGIPVFGSKGASIHVRSFTSALVSSGHEVRVMAFNLEGNNPSDERISYYQIGQRKNVKDKWKWLVEVINSSGSIHDQEKQPAGSMVSEMKKLDMMGRAVDNINTILYKHPVDILLERLSLYGGAGMMVSKKFNIPHIIEMNAPISKETETWRGLYFKETAYSIERKVLNTADGIIVVSKELKNILLKMGVPQQKILVLPNGVNVNLFTPKQKNSQLAQRLGLKDKFIVGFTGSLKKWHGVDILMEACAGLIDHIPELRLLIVGDGPEIENLKSRAVSLKIFEKTTFTGKIPYSEIPDFIRLMDVAAAPYKTNGSYYFSPLKVIEYLACGIPVVTLKNEAIDFGVHSGKNGIVIEEMNSNHLRHAVKTLYDKQDLREKISANAPRLAVGRDWQDVSRKAAAFFEEIKNQR